MSLDSIFNIFIEYYNRRQAEIIQLNYHTTIHAHTHRKGLTNCLQRRHKKEEEKTNFHRGEEESEQRSLSIKIEQHYTIY